MVCSFSPETWTAWGTWALVVVTWVSIFVTIWFIRKQIRASKEASALQLFVQLTGEFQDQRMRHLRKTLARYLHARLADSATAIDPLADDTVLQFFENIGYLTHIGFLDNNVIWNYFSHHICGYWTAAKPEIEALRRMPGNRDLYDEMEWLHNEMLRLDRIKGHDRTEWLGDRTTRFLKLETSLL